MRLHFASVLLLAVLAPLARGDEVDDALKAVLAVGPKGEGADKAAPAVRKLSQLDSAELLRLFAALDGASPLASNYLRASIEAVADRELAAGNGKLPVQALENYMFQRKHNPAGRRLAYDFLVRAEPAAARRYLRQLLNDPSVELRRDAVALKAAEAAQFEAREDQLRSYQAAFDAAVDDDQVKELAAKLKEFGVTVDIAGHYGFVPKWHLVGPFDNKDEKGYAVPHGPEGEAIDTGAAYDGSHDAGKVTWKDFTTADDYGKVDLNTAIGKHMGAIAYAVAFFAAEEAQPVELRWNSKNACKLWLNDKLIDAREVYHQDGGPVLDQYISRGELQAGSNTILLKVCQNEQTENWAQDWGFQLRVCDSAGAAVLSAERIQKPE
jgi:hypothetical protein